MKFYIFNQKHSANIGDQLIGQIINRTLTDEGHRIVNNKAYKSNKSRLHKLRQHVRSYLSDITVLREVDSLVIGGGNLVMDTAGLGWAVHQFWLGLLCRFFNKEYYYLCVGATPLQHYASKVLYRFALNHAKKVSVRDSGSQAYLQQLTARTDIEVIPDPVLAVSAFYPLQPTRSNVIGLCPVQFEKVVKQPSLAQILPDKYIDLHVRLAEYFVAQGYIVQIFLNDPDFDRETAVEIMKRANLNTTQLMFKPIPADHAAYLEYISSLRFLVTSRMHAAICAISYGVPCIALGWQPKVKYLFDDLGREGNIDIVALLVQTELDQGVKQIVELFQRLRSQDNGLFSEKSGIVDFLTG